MRLRHGSVAADRTAELGAKGCGHQQAWSNKPAAGAGAAACLSVEAGQLPQCSSL